MKRIGKYLEFSSKSHIAKFDFITKFVYYSQLIVKADLNIAIMYAEYEINQ